MTTPRKDRNIQTVAYYLYFSKGYSPESTNAEQMKTAIDTVVQTGFERAEFTNRFGNINETVFDKVINEMWKMDGAI
jgi:hypothetical protein